MAAVEEQGSDAPVYAGRSRWTMKLDFVIAALRTCDHAAGEIIVIADVDIVVRRPFAHVIRHYMRGRDIIFQADNGFKVRHGMPTSPCALVLH